MFHFLQLHVSISYSILILHMLVSYLHYKNGHLYSLYFFAFWLLLCFFCIFPPALEDYIANKKKLISFSHMLLQDISPLGPSCHQEILCSTYFLRNLVLFGIFKYLASVSWFLMLVSSVLCGQGSQRRGVVVYSKSIYAD